MTLTGKYWARVPGRTDWFLLDLKRVDPDQMAGLEFLPFIGSPLDVGGLVR